MKQKQYFTNFFDAEGQAQLPLYSNTTNYMGLYARIPVLEVSYIVRLNQACSSTETS